MDDISIDNFFGTRLARELNKLRIDGVLTDFAICIDEELIKAHKNVLAANSDYFRAMLTSESSDEIKNGQVTLKDVDPVAVKLLVDFWYTGRMKLEGENVCSLLLTASRFQSSAALEVGTEFARANLTAANCLSIAITCERCNLVELFEIAFILCLKHFDSIIEDTEILGIDEDLLIKIISDDKLNVTDETHVFEFIVRWIEFDEKSRSDSLDKLMSQVRYTSIDPVDLFKPSITNLIDSSAKYRASFEKAKTILMLKDYPVLLQEQIGQFNSNPRKTVLAENRRLYVFGGASKASASSSFVTLTEVYDPIVDQWSDLSHTKASVGEHLAIAISENCIYALSEKYLSRKPQYYKLDTNEWSFGEHLFDRTTAAGYLVALAGCIYFFGEFTDDNQVSPVIKYDLEKKTSTDCAPMQKARRDLCYVAHSHYIYAIGGMKFTCNNHDHDHDDWGDCSTRCVERYDTRSDKWEFVASMFGERHTFGSCVCRDKIYVAGGLDSGIFMNSAEVYDPRLNTWTKIEPLPSARGYSSLVELMGQVYAIGGFGDDPINDVVAYDPDSNKWVQKRGMRSKRFGHCAVVV